MVIGIGIDIIEIDRIKDSVDKYGEQFLNKVFTKNEIAYCLSKPDKYQHLGARFAAKEAIYKALASNWTKGVSWQDIEIKNEPNGLPYAVLNGDIKSFLSGDKGLRISLTHSRDYVASVAIVYKEE
jgi:holo-[acyl-carrier protein] synthase